MSSFLFDSKYGSQISGKKNTIVSSFPASSTRFAEANSFGVCVRRGDTMFEISINP